MSSFDSQICYPRSFVHISTLSRSRVLSEEIATYWNVQITGIESIEDRARKYHLFFSLMPDQIKCIQESFASELKKATASHAADKNGQPRSTHSRSLRLADTFLPGVPEFKILAKESKVVLHLHEHEPASACASVVKFHKNKTIDSKKTVMNLKQASDKFRNGLLDANAPALQLFDSLAKIVDKAITDNGLSCETVQKIGVSLGFPLEHRSLSEATLLKWTKGFATGRKTEDPAEGMDLHALLNCAFDRAKMNLQVSSITNDSVAVYLTACHDAPANSPRCAIGFTIGQTPNLCYYLPDAKSSLGFATSLMVCDIGAFNRDLPTNDVDVEINFHDEVVEQEQRHFEMMVAADYLEELCRCVVVKVWQSEAPRLAWVYHSMPWLACISIIEDETENLSITEKSLSDLWDWETTIEQRRAVQELFQAVFSRAAMLCAIVICTAGIETGLLQPAMGGCTVAIAGCLYEESKFFRKSLDQHQQTILPPAIAPLLHLYYVKDGVSRGAALATAVV